MCAGASRASVACGTAGVIGTARGEVEGLPVMQLPGITTLVRGALLTRATHSAPTAQSRSAGARI